VKTKTRIHCVCKNDVNSWIESKTIASRRALPKGSYADNLLLCYSSFCGFLLFYYFSFIRHVFICTRLCFPCKTRTTIIGTLGATENERPDIARPKNCGDWHRGTGHRGTIARVDILGLMCKFCCMKYYRGLWSVGLSVSFQLVFLVILIKFIVM